MDSESNQVSTGPKAKVLEVDNVRYILPNPEKKHDVDETEVVDIYGLNKEVTKCIRDLDKNMDKVL